jgi:hypothetical protein
LRKQKHKEKEEKTRSRKGVQGVLHPAPASLPLKVAAKNREVTFPLPAF